MKRGGAEAPFIMLRDGDVYECGGALCATFEAEARCTHMSDGVGAA
jgi:hypothetical protein